MCQWIFYVLLFSILILDCRSQETGVCKKYDVCNGNVYNNVSYTCERRYMKSTRCQLLTLTKVIDIMETQNMYAEFEKGLSELDKVIKRLSCQLHSRPYCEFNGDCHVQGKCDDTLNVANSTNRTENGNGSQTSKQRCQDGFSFHCEGKEPGTSSKWCFRHCSVGWAQCNKYCNCSCRSNQLPVSTPAPFNVSIPKCNRRMKLSCTGKLEVIPDNWCSSYCGRNGPLCLKYCNCECVRKNVKGFFTQHNIPETTAVYTTVRTTEIPQSTRPTLTRTPSLITCRIGFYLKCVSLNKFHTSKWCTLSCGRRDCPGHCSCKCALRRSSGFIPVGNGDRNNEIKFPTDIGYTSTPRMSTTTTTSTTQTTIPATTTTTTVKPKTTKATTITMQVSTPRTTRKTITPVSIIVIPTPRTTPTPITTTQVMSMLTQSPYLDMCSNDFIFKCRGKQFGIRHEWCTKQCKTGSSHCQRYCVCGCVRLKNATRINELTSDAPEFDFVTTTPAIIVTKVTNFCHAGHISCKWKGPNLGPVNHDMLRWCQDVCSVNSDHCSELRHMCECKCLRFKKRVKMCRPSEQMKHNPAIATWCRRNCIAGHCPKTHCACEYVLI